MAITGIHTLLYTSEPDAVRDILRDVFGWRFVDEGGGWLIFALPPAELAAHPADEAGTQLYLMCHDIEATTAEMREKGVELTREVSDEGWGLVTAIALPGGGEIGLYEPRHPVP